MSPTLLALGAHYDDCVFGIPGIMVKAVRQGYRVVILAMIGDYANFAPAIGREAALVEGSVRICRDHGAELRFLDFKSQHYDVTAETKMAVAQAVADVRPDVAFMLWPHDRHADHGPAARLSEIALRHAGPLLGLQGEDGYRPPRRIYAYDNGPRHTIGFDPDVYVDITQEWPEAMAWLGELMALAHNRSYDPNVQDSAQHAKETLAAYRGATCGVRYAEALRSTSAYPQEILSSC